MQRFAKTRPLLLTRAYHAVARSVSTHVATSQLAQHAYARCTCTRSLSTASTPAGASVTSTPSSASAPPALPSLPPARSSPIGIDEFLHGPLARSSLPTLSSPPPIIDVRAPIEFLAGHIPGALSLPIFPDEDRARIGTLYRKASKQKAIMLGLELFGPRMGSLLLEAQKIASASGGSGGIVRLHCARGGMRSQAMQWLLELGGLRVQLLGGGYKEYRRWVQDRFSLRLSRPLIVLGGLTGSGKTRVLHALSRRGESTLDLEGIASHKGSAFGSIGCEPQPTREMFENNLAKRMQELDEEMLRMERQLSTMVDPTAATADDIEPAFTLPLSTHPPPFSTPSPHIWVEDESRMIGSLPIPLPLYSSMSSSKLIVLRVPLAVRTKQLADEYCRHDPQLLRESIGRITRKLGLERARKAMEAIDANDMETMVTIALQYYDKAYSYGLGLHVARVPHLVVDTHTGDAEINADLLLRALQKPTWSVPVVADIKAMGSATAEAEDATQQPSLTTPAASTQHAASSRVAAVAPTLPAAAEEAPWSALA